MDIVENTDNPIAFRRTMNALQEPKRVFYWSGIDTRNAIISSALPLGVTFAKWRSIEDEPRVKAFLSTSMPDWMPKSTTFYTLMDFGTATPLGYASYLAYKIGSADFKDETRCALYLYGVTQLSCLLKILAMKSLDTRKVALTCTLSTALTSATAYAFYKIDKMAGYLMLPMAIWTGFYTLPWAIRALNGIESPYGYGYGNINNSSIKKQQQSAGPHQIKVTTQKGPDGEPLKREVEILPLEPGQTPPRQQIGKGI